PRPRGGRGRRPAGRAGAALGRRGRPAGRARDGRRHRVVRDAAVAAGLLRPVAGRGTRPARADGLAHHPAGGTVGAAGPRRPVRRHVPRARLAEHRRAAARGGRWRRGVAAVAPWRGCRAGGARQRVLPRRRAGRSGGSPDARAGLGRPPGRRVPCGRCRRGYRRRRARSRCARRTLAPGRAAPGGDRGTRRRAAHRYRRDRAGGVAMTWVLVAVLAVPAVGAVFRSRAVAAGAAAIAFLLSVALATGRSDGGLTGPIRPWHQLDVSWVPGLNLRFHLGVDGISYPLVVLTTLLTLLCCVYLLWTDGDGTLAALLLVIEVGIVGVFLALDLVLFFVFFEIVLLPMYAVIAGWGGAGRRPAARKFVLYTLFGSVLLLVGVFVVVSLAVTAILVGGLVCLAQTELKRLIAYSSVGHMGFVLLGIATLTATGFEAALIGNVAHGIITGLLFFLAGAIKDRAHTGDLSELGG